jgi:hypothetical protein
VLIHVAYLGVDSGECRRDEVDKASEKEAYVTRKRGTCPTRPDAVYRGAACISLANIFKARPALEQKQTTHSSIEENPCTTSRYWRWSCDKPSMRLLDHSVPRSPRTRTASAFPDRHNDANFTKSRSALRKDHVPLVQQNPARTITEPAVEINRIAILVDYIYTIF